MKQKLLITLGCSHTEGVGCWDLDNMPNDIKPGSKDFSFYYEKNQQRFHERGWPNKVGKKLGYDKVLNLGRGGASISQNVKQFFEKCLDSDYSNYDVLLIWLLPEPSRISFYKGRVLKSISNYEDFHKEYIKWLTFEPSYNITSLPIGWSDFTLDWLFHRRILQEICHSKGWNFLTIDSSDTLWMLENKRWGPIITNTYPQLINSIKNHLWECKLDSYFYNQPYHGNLSFCGHVNEDGYEIWASNIDKYIRDNHPNMIGGEPKENIEWEYIGNPERQKD